MNKVEWADEARDQLADIWVAARPAERAIIEGEIIKLESDLAADPFAIGESRSGSIRIVMRAMLVFWFNVAEPRPRIIRVRRPHRK